MSENILYNFIWQEFQALLLFEDEIMIETIKEFILSNKNSLLKRENVYEFCKDIFKEKIMKFIDNFW